MLPVVVMSDWIIVTVGMNFCGMVFVQLVYLCAHECQTAGIDICTTIAENLLDISAKVMKTVDPIVKLYANALLIKTYYDRTSTNYTKDERGRRLLNDGQSLLESVDLLEALITYFRLYCKNKCVSPKVSIECTEEYNEDYMILWFKALNFFCLLLAEAVEFVKIDDTVLHDVFYTYCDAFKMNNLLILLYLSDFPFNIGLLLERKQPCSGCEGNEIIL
ncbi:hypothetical protein Dsin_017389 [Dipteronia sinensis]|uniref:Separase-like second TPR repeats region domain-containing protein n=1 Tax=Dipteronia sinensis TaxID=43782 RepID=A0AAE0AFV0_9ROSI|nr:hypothetical protein Dsin_017389 [Dipteronia sinensis]